MSADRLQSMLESLDVSDWNIGHAQWLRDEMSVVFETDLTDDFTAGLVGEYEAMDRRGLRLRARDIPVDTMRTQVLARLEAYGAQFLVLIDDVCWCGRFHMDPVTELGHEVVSTLRIPQLVDWLNSKVLRNPE